jgi:ABC-2 type transport system permease protein
MNIQHMKAIALKELFHILRDRGTFALVTIGPIFLMIVFTYTLTSEVTNASVAIIDHADNATSHELIQRINDAKVTNVTQHLDSEDAVDDLFKDGDAVAVIIIPADYGQISPTGSMPQVEAIIDGTEPVSAEKVLDEVYRIADAHAREVAEASLADTNFDPSLLQSPIKVKEDTLYNPNLSSVVDFYPGLASMMLGLPAIAMALAFARESEMGTLEQLVATPINKRSLLMGKMLPYLVFGMIDVYILLVMGRVVYDVPFRGSIFAYSLIAFLFIVANLGFGMLIAVLVRSQQVAMIVAILVFFVPPFFLSGLFFPVDAMPKLVQLELIEIPSTHYVAASKAIQLQGTSLLDLWFPTLLLVILAVELLEIATFIFRKKVILTFSLRNLFGKEKTA